MRACGAFYPCRFNQSMIAPRTDWAPVPLASVITPRASLRSTRRSKAFTGPMLAGRIERDRIPIAAKHKASTGRPASSPQKLKSVSVSPQR